MDARRLYPWLLRAGWVALPLVAGPALASALRPHSDAVRLAASVLLWAAWAVVLLGTLVPVPAGLTGLRIAAPAGAAAAIAAAATGRPSTLAASAAVAITLVDTATALAPTTGVLYANGPAYPNERRFPLRPPLPLLLGPLEVCWAVTVAVPVGGVLLLAARAWVAGAVVLIVGLPIAVLLARAMHGLSRRWVVFVPAGVVIHDPMTLLEPVLFGQKAIETLRPASADTDSLDLTQRAPGLSLELILREKTSMVLVRPGRVGGEPGASARVLFTPTRPGRVLAEAVRRRMPVG